MSDLVLIADDFCLRDELLHLVLDALPSANSRRSYERALKHFFAWYRRAASGPLTKSLVQQYRAAMERSAYSPATINLHLTAVRKLATEAADNALMDKHLAAGISRVRGPVVRGTRLGNWLTNVQAAALIAAPRRRHAQRRP
jgi:site-specific recombinase XerD